MSRSRDIDAAPLYLPLREPTQSPGWQVLATGIHLYAIVPDGSAVVEYLGGDPLGVPLAAQQRDSTGQTGGLLATNANADIYQ